VESLKAWYDAGAPAVGMGSKLLTSDLIERGDWDGLQQRIGDTVAAVAAARSEA
jgi:2-dehydro-3-deoxyphosphogluconate aldolase/(4S)-4-hydroxy-2-oxoglutarate aldolase